MDAVVKRKVPSPCQDSNLDLLGYLNFLGNLDLLGNIDLGDL